MLGYFSWYFCRLQIFFKVCLFEKFFNEHYQSVKQFGSRSGLTFCRAWSGSKLFAKIFSRRRYKSLSILYWWAITSYHICLQRKGLVLHIESTINKQRRRSRTFGQKVQTIRHFSPRIYIQTAVMDAQLTLFGPMEFPIKYNALIMLIWDGPLYILRGFRLWFNPKNIVVLSLKIDFVFKLENSANPDEMLHDNCSISSGFSLFAKVPVLGFWVSLPRLHCVWNCYDRPCLIYSLLAVF